MLIHLGERWIVKKKRITGRSEAVDIRRMKAPWSFIWRSARSSKVTLPQHRRRQRFVSSFDSASLFEADRLASVHTLRRPCLQIQSELFKVDWSCIAQRRAYGIFKKGKRCLARECHPGWFLLQVLSLWLTRGIVDLRETEVTRAQRELYWCHQQLCPAAAEEMRGQTPAFLLLTVYSCA